MYLLKSKAKRLLARTPRLYMLVRRLWRSSPFFGYAGASDHWDRLVDQVEGGAHRGWLDVQFVEEEYVRPQVSGDRNVYYLSHFFDSHFDQLPLQRGLSLGCGGGNLERGLIAMDAALSIDAVDASPSSIALAEKLALSEGIADRINYAVADIDQLQLDATAYDWIICKMSLHHFEALEHVYQQISKALRPGGLFMFNEFVGPTRHQWSDIQLDLMNQMLASVPPTLRSRVPMRRIERPSVREMIAIDPSESVRSAEIMPLLERWFEVVEYKPYGGTLLQVFLQEVLPVLDLESAEHQDLLRGWFRFEQAHLESGEIPSDFAYVVARPKLV